jgi:hypothetical protein
MIAPGYFTCHFVPGQCSKSSRTLVRSGFSALAVNKLSASITPGLQSLAEYVFIKESSRPKSRLFFGKNTTLSSSSYSSQGEAANEFIPMSLLKYVIRVNESSQRSHGSKNEEDRG